MVYQSESMMAELIAPCGINCRVCRFHMKEKKPCPGCRSALLTGHCLNCKLKNCGKFNTSSSGYCYDCADYPCGPMKQLDKRYRTNYGASPVNNLNRIQASGVEVFLESETRKWTCPTCGEILCMHVPQCAVCGTLWNTGKLV